MKAIKERGCVSLSQWYLDIMDSATAEFRNSIESAIDEAGKKLSDTSARTILAGVSEALDVAMEDEGIIVFHGDGSFGLHVPLSDAELTNEPVFKFDLLENIREQISFQKFGDDREHLEKIRDTLLKGVELLNEALK